MLCLSFVSDIRLKTRRNRIPHGKAVYHCKAISLAAGEYNRGTILTDGTPMAAFSYSLLFKCAAVGVAVDAGEAVEDIESEHVYP